MGEYEILDMCNIITSHPRDVFMKNMSTLYGERFHDFVLQGCKLNPANDVVDLYLLDDEGRIHTFAGYVHRSVMDYSPAQLRLLFKERIARAMYRR